jgi:hypothetical protein
LWYIDPLLGKNLETNNEISDLFLRNGSVNTFLENEMHTTIHLQWKRSCFLCGPCLGVKKKTIGADQLSVESQPVKRRLGS